MQVLKRSFEFYVFGNIHVAVAAYCLTKISLLLFDINNQPLANFVFFSTVLSYNFIRLFQVDRLNSMMAIWIRANKRALIVLNSFAFLGCGYYLLNFKLVEIFVLFPFVLATLFYVFPFKNKIAGLRNVPGLKLFLISITWAGLTLYLPLFSAEFQNSEQLYTSMTQRFLFIFAITIPFDIRDAQFDLPGLNTIPQVLGVNKSKMIAIAALLIAVVLDTRIAYEDPNYLWINLFIMGLSMMMIAFSGPQRRRFYTAFWIEALPVLWYLLYLVFIK
jgi:hypothetical protein